MYLMLKKFIDIIYKKKKVESSSICMYPFMNMMVTANGKYKPCCKWSEVLTDHGKELQAPENTLLDAWNSDEMKQLRVDFLDGKMPAKCAVCWNEEKSGIQSMRYDSFNYGVDANNLNAIPFPIRLDIYPSNVCNLKCRICSPEYSNRWIEEARDTLGIDEEVHLNLTRENQDQIEKWLPNIVEIGLFGGEPLFLKECYALMEKCVELGYSKNITLLINTNGSIYSKKLIDIFSKFKKTHLNFSIDDIEERFEYQRKGGKWHHTLENIKKYLTSGGTSHKDIIECKICCTVSSLNIFYLPEIFELISNEFPGMAVYLNFLHGPYSLSAKNLPLAVKSIIKNRLIKNKKFLDIQFDAKQTRTLENIIDFLDLESNIPFSEFFNEIQRGDKYRNESFENTFPEFWEIIKSYKY
jgi:MoaA/NifB/PqqE/SkfB family radical SAM enzyme